MSLLSILKEVVQEGKANYNRKGMLKSEPHSECIREVSNTKVQQSKNLEPFNVRIVGECLQIRNTNGGVLRTHSLPPGKYSNVIVAGDSITVTIEYKHYGVKYRTIDARTGSIISENY